jgi:hypothetical protein
MTGSSPLDTGQVQDPTADPATPHHPCYETFVILDGTITAHNQDLR